MDTSCLACSEIVPADASCCEACGEPLPATRDLPRCECGGEVVGGACYECGSIAMIGNGDFESGGLTAFLRSHRGVVHPRNEDYAAFFEFEGGVAIVVSDGISSSQSPHLASRAASSAALAAVAREIGRSLPLNVLRDAYHAAWAAVQQVPGEPLRGDQATPGCTFVVTLVLGRELYSLHVGDSRAYWLGDNGEAVQLTRDCSLAEERIAAGMSPAESMAQPDSHTITSWIGKDEPMFPPIIGHRSLSGPGNVVVVSDGVWNYVANASTLKTLLTGATPKDRLDRVIAHALNSGGADNATIAIALIDSPLPS